MPWKQQGGGGGGPWGGGGSGGGQGPWGGKPSGGGGGGGSAGGPPDIEDLIRKGQDRVKNIMPGGFGGARGIIIAVLLVVIVWLLSGLYRVQPRRKRYRTVVRSLREHHATGSELLGAMADRVGAKAQRREDKPDEYRLPVSGVHWSR